VTMMRGVACTATTCPTHRSWYGAIGIARKAIVRVDRTTDEALR
jgi:hypothetical protein